MQLSTTFKEMYLLHGQSFIFSEGMQLDTAGTAIYLLTTPAHDPVHDPHIHCRIEINAALAANMTFEEGGDRVGSVAQTCYNRNRSFPDLTTFTLYKGYGGGTTNGTEIFSAAVGSATSFPLGVGGGGVAGEEWILDHGTQYILIVTSESDDNNITVKFHFDDVHVHI
jgi:hypothetical protein